MRHLLFHLALLLAMAPIPERAPPGKGLPDLSYESNWGTVKQEGRQITIGGHAHWTATGEIQKDGRVYLLWTTVADAQLAPALYEVRESLKGQCLVGKWGWLRDVEFDEDGNITGELRDDTTYRK